MTYPPKRRAPTKPTRKQVMAAFDAFAPIDGPMKRFPQKPARRKPREDRLDDIGSDDTK